MLYGLQAAEVFEQTARGGFADAGDFAQLGGAVANLAALAMEGHGEAMGFVADLLHQMQDGRMMVEHDGIVFLSVDVNDLFSFRDRGERLVDDLESIECLSGGVELSEAAIDQDEARHV